jgi:hypothetical protein
MPVSILTNVFTSPELPELQMSLLEDQRIFHNVLVHSLDITHTSISVHIVGIYFQLILHIKFKREIMFSKLLAAAGPTKFQE